MSFDCLEEHSIISLESDNFLRCQLFQDEPNICDTQSSEIVESIFKQSPQFNSSKTPYEELF